MGNPDLTIPMYLVAGKELSILGSFRQVSHPFLANEQPGPEQVRRTTLMLARYGPGDYAMSISLVARGLISLTPLITHRFSFLDAVEAFEVTSAGKDRSGKVGPVLSPHGRSGQGQMKLTRNFTCDSLACDQVHH
jgi:D-xylulose reductase